MATEKTKDVEFHSPEMQIFKASMNYLVENNKPNAALCCDDLIQSGAVCCFAAIIPIEHYEEFMSVMTDKQAELINSFSKKAVIADIETLTDVH